MGELRDKTPPHNDEAERAYLCSILIEPALIMNLGVRQIKPDDFYSRRNMRIYEAMLSLHKVGLSPDLTALKTKLIETNKLEEAGGADYLSAVSTAVPSSANAEYYMETVKNCSLRRSMLNVASKIGFSAYDETLNETSVIREAINDLIELIT